MKVSIILEQLVPLPDVVAVILVVYKIAETLSESSEFNDFLKVVQEVAIKILSQISSIKT